MWLFWLFLHFSGWSLGIISLPAPGNPAPPVNLVADPQLVRGAYFPEMECWEPSAISLETPMEGHLGGTGVDGRQLTAGRGKQIIVPKGSPPPAPKGARFYALEGWSCWRTNTTTEDCQWSTE